MKVLSLVKAYVFIRLKQDFFRPIKIVKRKSLPCSHLFRKTSNAQFEPYYPVTSRYWVILGECNKIKSSSNGKLLDDKENLNLSTSF